jgi:hypothetical protein
VVTNGLKQFEKEGHPLEGLRLAVESRLTSHSALVNTGCESMNSAETTDLPLIAVVRIHCA